MAPRFDLRRAIHIKLWADTLAEFRIALLKRGLTMQEVIEEFIQRIILGDRVCTRLLDDLVDRHKLRIRNKMTATDAESIFDAIEMDEIANKELDDECREGQDDNIVK